MDILNQLTQAASRPKEEISPENLFREIGFDGQSPRLGWVLSPSRKKIEETLTDIALCIQDKEEFIFVGIGGSGNGIKTLLSLDNNAPIHCIDSLDPQALDDVLKKIKNKEKTLVIPISKSGSTAETQLISKTIKKWFGDAWQTHFLWLSDKGSFEKLDNAGWQGAMKRTIQVDGASDIGGRFTCPHTLIFLLPLFILYNRDIKKVCDLFTEYTDVYEPIEKKAYALAQKYRDEDPAFFSIIVPENIKEAFGTWVTQLIQESLGSKKDGFFVKTIVETYTVRDFLPVTLDFSQSNPFLYLMLLMHFLQVFVACFAHSKKINFVNQPSVEAYKKTMRQLQEESLAIPDEIDTERLVKEIADRIKPEQFFIEVVLYGDYDGKFIQDLRNKINAAFSDKILLVFLGSDWNHHSYQAAAQDTTTLYVILGKKEYQAHLEDIPAETLQDNIDTLRRISLATYQTIKDHAIYFSI